MVTSGLCPEFSTSDLLSLDLEESTIVALTCCLETIISISGLSNAAIPSLLNFLSLHLAEISRHEIEISSRLQKTFEKLYLILEEIRKVGTHNLKKLAISTFVGGFSLFFRDPTVRINYIQNLLKSRSSKEFISSCDTMLLQSLFISLGVQANTRRGLLPLLVSIEDVANIPVFINFMSLLIRTSKSETLISAVSPTAPLVDTKADVNSDEVEFHGFKLSSIDGLLFDLLKELLRLSDIFQKSECRKRNKYVEILVLISKEFIISSTELFTDLVKELKHLQLSKAASFNTLCSCIGRNNSLMRCSFLSFVPLVTTALSSSTVLTSKEIICEILTDFKKFLAALDELNQLLPGSVQSFNDFITRLKDENTNSFFCQSPHPYSSGMQVFQESYTVPGATMLLITFDEKCSTKNEQDTVIISNDSSFKFTYFGSKTDKNYNWPRNNRCVISGDTAHIAFNAYSHSSEGDSKSRWGFKCSVKGLYIQRLAWLADMELTASILCSKLASNLITAPLSLCASFFSHISVPEVESFSRTGLVLKPIVESNSLCNGLEFEVSEKSTSLKYLSLFVSGDPLAQRFINYVDSVSVRFMGEAVIKSLPEDIRKGICLKFEVLFFI